MLPDAMGGSLSASVVHAPETASDLGPFFFCPPLPIQGRAAHPFAQIAKEPAVSDPRAVRGVERDEAPTAVAVPAKSKAGPPAAHRVKYRLFMPETCRNLSDGLRAIQPC